jgi:hypothetical protein
MQGGWTVYVAWVGEINAYNISIGKIVREETTWGTYEYTEALC